MVEHRVRRVTTCALAMVAVGCAPTSPTVILGVRTPPDFSASVISTTHQQGEVAPGGFLIDQYALQVAVTPSDTASVVVGPRAPVYLQAGDALVRDSAADISPGDVIEVWQWLDGVPDPAKGSPGAPGFITIQVVIER
jgi:hypothetical protein